MKTNSAPCGLSRFPLTAAVVIVLLASASGCATRNTSSSGRETTVLAGALSVATDSFQPTPPASIDVDTSKLVGRDGPSGTKVSFLWGLFTLHDY